LHLEIEGCKTGKEFLTPEINWCPQKCGGYFAASFQDLEDFGHHRKKFSG